MTGGQALTLASPAQWIAPTRKVENAVCAAALLLMAVLPVLEIVLRSVFRTGIPGNSGYVQNLALWVGFLGAMMASREGKHLSLSTAEVPLRGTLGGVAASVTAVASTAVATGLFWASLQFVGFEMMSPVRIAGWLPMWVVESILPIAFAVIALRFAAAPETWRERGVAFLGIPIAAGFGLLLGDFAAALLWPAMAVLFVAALFGAPIFVVLGGASLLLFFAADVPAAAIPVEIYRIVLSPAIPTIPLFTLTGFLLAEGRASERLVRLFRALFGWLPGGAAVVTTLVCAFFASFTGASGVTILALGGLLLPVLLKHGYRERFSIGLLTATGSIGLLFPPSLAVILYGVVAHVPIPDLFVAGIVPGILMVAVVSVFGLYHGLGSSVGRQRFDLWEAGAAAWGSIWEILLPAVVLVGLFGGYTTLIEAAALTVIYTLFTEILIHRDIHPWRDLPRVVIKCAGLVGGIFAIMAAAIGLTGYLVDDGVPMKAAIWVQAHIESRMLFLLALNVFLLIVGCLMDIFSAIMVVVPLILPIGVVFGIDPLHLAMIFLVNLELGYLTPPVGMNLFVASYRFDRPLMDIYRSVLPFLGMLILVVLLVTYFPGLIIGVD